MTTEKMNPLSSKTQPGGRCDSYWTFDDSVSPVAVDDYCWIKDDSWVLDEYQLCQSEMYRRIRLIRKCTNILYI